MGKGQTQSLNFALVHNDCCSYSEACGEPVPQQIPAFILGFGIYLFLFFLNVHWLMTVSLHLTWHGWTPPQVKSSYVLTVLLTFITNIGLSGVTAASKACAWGLKLITRTITKIPSHSVPLKTRLLFVGH